MSRISKEDWTRLSAYHDREMSLSEQAAFEKRLTSEPDLHIALQHIKLVGATLKADPPAARTARLTRPLRLPKNHRRTRRLVAPAGAVAGIFLLLLGGFPPLNARAGDGELCGTIGVFSDRIRCSIRAGGPDTRLSHHARPGTGFNGGKTDAPFL